MMTPDLNPALQPVAFLLGLWQGEGAGEYPTINAFRYREEIRFSHNGKPFLIYAQKTFHPESGQPMHTETGYLRVPASDRAELLIAQPIGFAEVSLGSITNQRIDFTSASVLRTPTAKPVTAINRSFWLDGDTLRYEMAMATEGTRLTRHLTASFHRAKEAG